MKTHTLILVSRGPKYDPVRYFRSRLDAIKRGYQGFLVTSSPTPVKEMVGSFIVIAKKFYSSKMVESISFLYGCVSLRNEVKRNGGEIDLIVCFDPIRSGILGLYLKWLFDAKLAVEINGIYESYINYSDYNNIFLARVKGQIYKRIVSFVVNRSDGVRLLFDGQADSFLKPGSDFPLVRQFSEFVDIEPFLLCPSDLSKKRVLFVGYPHFLKGVDILIEAFSMLFEDFPDWELTILGWYPDKKVIDDALKGTRNIVYHPPVKEADMPAQMADHSIFVLPSRVEAMGRVLVEAMATGTARVGANCGGIPTVIEDGVDGFLFENGSVIGLVSCLRRLMDSEELRKNFAEAAKNRVVNDFTKENYLTNVTEFYNSVIENGG